MLGFADNITLAMAYAEGKVAIGDIVVYNWMECKIIDEYTDEKGEKWTVLAVHRLRNGRD